MAKLLAEKNKLENSRLLYLILSGLFISALVTCNLIANKFVTVDLGFKTFVVSAGVLPYPLTFLITDILSEIYGRKRTNNVVLAGLIASILVLFILYLGSVFPAIDDSPVANETYNSVFQNSSRIIFASMLAYTVAQFVDVHVFHFLKKLTGGKKLWIRNNFSTIFSQLLDTILVTTVIFIGLKDFTLDTLFIYLIVYGIRSYFQLKPNEELSI